MVKELFKIIFFILFHFIWQCYYLENQASLSSPTILSNTFWIFLFVIHTHVCCGSAFPVSVELDKQSYCDLKVTNSTDQCVAFKVCFISIGRNSTNPSFLLKLIPMVLSTYTACFYLIGENYFSKEVLCPTKHWYYTAMGFRFHSRCRSWAWMSLQFTHFFLNYR